MVETEKLPTEVTSEGDKIWRNVAGEAHREDGPAVEFASGTKIWYRNGLPHRDDGPAAEYADGTREWLINGLNHRDDGPAVEYANGDRFWYKNGEIHRDDGPAVEFANGCRIWFDILPALKGGIPAAFRRKRPNRFGGFLLLTALLHRSLGRRSGMRFRARRKRPPYPPFRLSIASSREIGC